MPMLRTAEWSAGRWSRQKSHMPLHTVSEERTAGISQRGGQRLDALSASTFGAPILQLCLGDPADGVLRAVVDEEEELVGRVDLVGKKIGIAEVAAVAGEQKTTPNRFWPHRTRFC